MSSTSSAVSTGSLRTKPEVYKDKIEVSLDGRQIFYLFFGGAVIVGMVFVLGVMVGRRVEARGHVDRAQTDSRNDPLAALDRIEGGGMQPPITAPPVDKAIAAMAARTEVGGDKAAAEKHDVKPVDGKADPKTEKLDSKSVDKADKADKADSKADKVDSKADKADKTAKTDGKSSDKVDAKVEPKPEPEKKSRYTLQLSSFQDKNEAESFLDSVKSSGFAASITEADVAGKTYYRVRIGSYKSVDAANDAKAEFEKASKKSASVMKI